MVFRLISTVRQNQQFSASRDFSQKAGYSRGNMIRGESSPSFSAASLSGGNAVLHTAQVDQTMRMMPLMLLFHGVAAASIHLIAGNTVDIVIRTIWPFLCVFVAICLAVVYVLWNIGALRDNPSRSHGYIEVVGLILGIVWAMPMAAYAMRGEDGPILPLIAISLAVMGVAAMALLRAPIALVVFLSLMTAATARSAYLSLGEYSTMAAAIVTLYGFVLLALTLTSHTHFVRHTLSTAELKQQHDFTALLLSNLEQESNDWIWETDANGKLVYASPRLAQQLAISEEELLSGTLRGHFSGRLDPKSWQQLEVALLTREDFKPIRLHARQPAGERVWLVTGKALQDSIGIFQGFRGVGRDVTSQHLAEQRIADSQRAVETAAAAKSRFLSVMSHELRTPIHSIVGFAELLSKDRDVALNDKARREFTSSILDQARILQDLINDMLDATRLERGTIKLVEQDMDAAEVVELAINGCRAQAEQAGIDVIATLTEGVNVSVDASRLKQAISNILSNAIKFSEEHGIVHVEMQKTAVGGLNIEVRDAGVGISMQNIEKLFEPFAQADDSLTRRFNGLGLGLAIARKIMILHEGELVLQSSQGAGTTATLSLPPARVSWRKTVEPERLAG
jgi:PAS domain S-box-containing protein